MTVGGVTACKSQEDYDLIKFYQNMHGNIMSPMVAFLTLQVCVVQGQRISSSNTQQTAPKRFSCLVCRQQTVLT